MKLIPTYADVVCGECGKDALKVEQSTDRDGFFVTCPSGHVTVLSSFPILREIQPEDSPCT